MSRPSTQMKIPSLLKNALGQDDMSMKGISSITQRPAAKSGEIDDEINFDEFECDDEDEDVDEIELDTAAVANGDVDMDDKNMNRLASHIEQLFRYAIDGEEEKLVELLERTQLHPDAEDGAGHTPFLVAARHGRLGVMKRLLSDGCDPAHRTRNGNSAWMLAAAAGNMETLVFLIEEVGPLLSPREFENVLVNRNKDTIMMFGAMAGRLDVVQYLIRLGAAAGVLQSLPQGPSGRMHPLSLFNLNADGLTVVMCACDSGDIPTIKALLAAVQDAFGELPPEEERLLQDINQATLNSMDDKIKSALQGLGGCNMPKKPRKRTEVAPEDTETAAYLNHCDANGNTALHVACKLVHTAPVVEMLLHLGADPSLKNVNGQSAEDMWGDKGDRVSELMRLYRERKQQSADQALMELLGEDKKKKKKGKKAEKTANTAATKTAGKNVIESAVPAAEVPVAVAAEAEVVPVAVEETKTVAEVVKTEDVAVAAPVAAQTDAAVPDAPSHTQNPTPTPTPAPEPLPATPTAVSVEEKKVKAVRVAEESEEWHTVTNRKSEAKHKEKEKEKNTGKGDKKKEKDEPKKSEKGGKKKENKDVAPAAPPAKDQPKKDNKVKAKEVATAQTWAAKLGSKPAPGLPYPSRSPAPDSVQFTPTPAHALPMLSALPPASVSVAARAEAEAVLAAPQPILTTPASATTTTAPAATSTSFPTTFASAAPPVVTPIPASAPSTGICVFATTTPAAVPPVSTSTVPGALSRQLYRLDPRAEALAITPLHVLGHGISALSNEQVSCVETVLDTLLTNIRRVKEVRAERTANALAQQLADAQAAIAVLNLQLEELKKQ